MTGQLYFGLEIHAHMFVKIPNHRHRVSSKYEDAKCSELTKAGKKGFNITSD